MEIIILEICLLTFHIWMVLFVDLHFLDNQTQFGLVQTLMRSQHSDGLPCGGEHHKQSQQLNFSSLCQPFCVGVCYQKVIVFVVSIQDSVISILNNLL